MAKYAVWLYAQVDDHWAEQILGQIGGIVISDTSIWRRVKVWGEKIKAQAEAQCATANALPARGAVIRGPESTAQDMGVAMDAAKIYIREEGWKDLKAGCVFEIALRPERDQESGETVERAHAVENSYVGYLGGPAKFGSLMWTEAIRRGLPQARDSVVLGDGAPWIWNLAGEHFGSSWQGIDWFHADEHLYQAAQLVWGEGSAQTMRWVKGMEQVLYQGNAWYVAETLKGIGKEHPNVADALQTEAGYFEGNKRRMQYLELRENGFPIGSGMVESACKQFRARFTGAGMRWSRAGAERLIPTRAAVMSHRFDQVWSNAYNSPRR